MKQFLDLAKIYFYCILFVQVIVFFLLIAKSTNALSFDLSFMCCLWRKENIPYNLMALVQSITHTVMIGVLLFQTTSWKSTDNMSVQLNHFARTCLVAAILYTAIYITGNFVLFGNIRIPLEWISYVAVAFFSYVVSDCLNPKPMLERQSAFKRFLINWITEEDEG